jgi:6-phosphogluconolactonase/glucosamine-6-phosphate isomerase/deaminase
VSAGSTAAPFFERLVSLARGDEHRSQQLKSLVWLLVDDFDPAIVRRERRFEHDIGEAFFEPAGIPPTRIYTPGLHGRYYATYVTEAGGVLATVLASNPQGETAGNDVGSTLADQVRPVALSAYSRRKYARRFRGGEPVPRELVSTGLLFLMHHSRTIIAMFEGWSKLGPLMRLVEGRGGDDCPITHLLAYPSVRSAAPGAGAGLKVVVDARTYERLSRRIAASGYRG